MQDTVLQVGLCGDQVVISSTMITLNSLSDTNQRRIVADDVHEDESLTVSGVGDRKRGRIGGIEQVMGGRNGVKSECGTCT